MTPVHSLAGTNTLLVGATGAGKTHCIRTYIDAGITPFIIFTEPGMRTVSDIPCPKLHYKYIPPAVPSWDDLLDNARKINTMSFKMLTQPNDMNKQKYGQFLEVLTAMNSPTCDRCGETFEDVTTWQPDRVIVIDSLTGLNIMAMDMIVGAKPVKAIGEWGVAMDNLERFLNAMTTETRCHFALIAHLEREMDEITGQVHLMPATLGKKLAPKIPRFFDDVILCTNKEGKFAWSTMGLNIDLKWRNLPGARDLAPTFAPLITE